jgi:chromosome segregation ATPase
MATPTKPRPGQRIGAAQKLKKAMMTSRPNPFNTLVENTVDAYNAAGDGAVEDVRRILSDLRRQYDEVHNDCEKKERECLRLRESVRQAESHYSSRSEDAYKYEDQRASLTRQLEETTESIAEALTNRKVYHHMLERLKKERALLKQKLVNMEAHLARKTSEHEDKMAQTRLAKQHQAQATAELEACEYECQNEKDTTDRALVEMTTALNAKKSVTRRRKDFERWRHEVAMEAANEAFNASAGRLKKLWAVEKLGGNCLQKIIFEQVEKSQATEDGFQKIREVTGLTDVMDIVHKFLNRDVEHEQLKSAVKEAELKLESLREEYDHFKRETEGITFDTESGVTRKIYQEVEDCEAHLNKCLHDHTASRERLQKTTLILEQMRAWCKRQNQSLLAFEEAAGHLESHSQLNDYFSGLKGTVDKFLSHIQQQALVGKVQKKTGQQLLAKEHHERGRLLNDKEFVRSNCRVPAQERPLSAPQKDRQDDFDDPYAVMQAEREKYKFDSYNKIQEAMRKSAKNPKAKAKPVDRS